MSHTPPLFIKHGKNSSAFLSFDKPVNLVVFVHGFNGKATGTWDEFPGLIRDNDDFNDSDVIFYGYESLRGQANNNAIRFHNFLKTVCSNSPNKLGFKRDSITDDFSYERILIVAHSLGAIVTRRALLNAKLENAEWLDRCRMILFAPAHRGAKIPDLIAECLPAVGKVLAGLGFLMIPVLDDLRPSSQTIQNLIVDSQKYLDQSNGQFTIAHKVIWADGEKVVQHDSFCSDPVALLIENKGHISVCKPKHGYLDPYRIVVDALL